jgi:uncharacterized lipoprotein YehR (DUF1307 family)
MKKIISILISIVILASLAACGAAEESTVISPDEYDALNEK